jgi:hypothetical protein
LDVRALGYAPWSPREGSVEGYTGIGQICLPSDDQLVVTFVSQALPQTLPRRGQPEASSNLRLRALFIDARTGQLQAKHEWPTFSDKSRLTPATHGKFVVITPDKLTLYSPEIQPLKELDLDVGQDATAGSWGASSSPRGEYLLIGYGPRSNEHNPRGFLGAVRKLELIDTEALRVVRTWTDHGFGDIHPFHAFDDGEIIAINGTGGATVIGPPGGPWRSFRASWPARCAPSLQKTLITDEAIFGGTMLSIDRWCYSLTLTTGEILFAQEFDDKEIVRWHAASAGGRRFAIAVDKGRGGSWGLDIPAHYSLNRITVYDIPSRQWIFALSMKKQGIKSISGLALSPGGSLLAFINQDGILELYRIPEGSGPKQPGQ